MASFLRVFDQKSIFDDSKNWCNVEDVGRAVRVFTEDPNEVSLFRVESLRDGERAVAAFLLSHPRVVKAKAFIIVDEQHLQFAARKLSKSIGRTPDPVVNDWHYDLVGATDLEIATITFRFGRYGKLEKWSLSTAIERAKNHIEQKCVDPGSLSCDLRRFLNIVD